MDFKEHASGKDAESWPGERLRPIELDQPPYPHGIGRHGRGRASDMAGDFCIVFYIFDVVGIVVRFGSVIEKRHARLVFAENFHTLLRHVAEKIAVFRIIQILGQLFAGQCAKPAPDAAPVPQLESEDGVIDVIPEETELTANRSDSTKSPAVEQGITGNPEGKFPDLPPVVIPFGQAVVKPQPKKRVAGERLFGFSRQFARRVEPAVERFPEKVRSVPEQGNLFEFERHADLF